MYFLFSCYFDNLLLLPFESCLPFILLMYASCSFMFLVFSSFSLIFCHFTFFCFIFQLFSSWFLFSLSWGYPKDIRAKDLMPLNRINDYRATQVLRRPETGTWWLYTQIVKHSSDTVDGGYPATPGGVKPCKYWEDYLSSGAGSLPSTVWIPLHLESLYSYLGIFFDIGNDWRRPWIFRFLAMGLWFYPYVLGSEHPLFPYGRG